MPIAGATETDEVGDGTSTATLVAHAILADRIRNLAAGASAVDLKRGLDRGLRIAVASLKNISRPVSSRKENAQVARVRLGAVVAPKEIEFVTVLPHTRSGKIMRRLLE